MKTRFMAALASCLLACVAQANTIQLDMTGVAFDGGTNTTTFFYNVILTGGNGTPVEQSAMPARANRPRCGS